MLGSGNSCQLFDYGPESYENMPPDDITSPVIFVSKGFPYCKNIISVIMRFILNLLNPGTLYLENIFLEMSSLHTII